MTLYSVSMCTFMTSSFLVRYLIWFLPLLQLSWRLKQEGEGMKDAMPAFLVPLRTEDSWSSARDPLHRAHLGQWCNLKYMSSGGSAKGKISKCMVESKPADFKLSFYLFLNRAMGMIRHRQGLEYTATCYIGRSHRQN